MEVDKNTEELELQTVTATGGAVSRRLATPAAARSIYQNLLDEDMRGGARHRAIIQGMIDGNPPYNDAELKELGLGHVNNVNFLTMRANLDLRAASGHELFAEVPTLIECKPLHVVEQNPDIHHYCAIIAEEFTDMVMNWDGFLPAMDMVWRDSDAYGLGVGVFTNEWDWRIKSFRRGNLLVDPKASVEIDRNEVILVRDELTVSDVFAKLEKEEASRSRGWKVGPLKDLMVQTFREGAGTSDTDKYQRSTWESIQQMARNNDPDYQQRQFDRIRVIHFFVREVSGERKISHLILPELASFNQFLYEGHDKFDDMAEVIWWMPYNYGDGYIRSVRGVASYMMQHEDLSNRFLCRVFDAGFLGSSLLVQPRTQMDLSRLQMMQVGPLTIVPPELNIQQSSFQPQLAPLLQLRKVSEEVMKNNTGTYRQHNEAVDRDVQKTARQVIEESSKEARYEKAAIAARYTHLDKLYREMFRRVCRKDIQSDTDCLFEGSAEAREFMRRCQERNVPRDFIMKWNENFRVAAYRSIGLGSMGVKYDITAQIFQMSGAFDEHGKREALREAVAARVGYRHVDRFVARLDRDQVSSNESSIAMLEFNDIEEGSPVQVGSDQLHKVHILVFAQRLLPILQNTQQGQTPDPVKDFRTVQLALQHIGEHVQHIAQDPRYKAFLEQLKPFFQQVQEALQILQQAAKRLLQAQQQQQQQQEEVVANAQKIQQDRELEAKVFEIQRKFELEAMKQQSLNAMRAQKTKEQMEIAQTRAQAEIARKAERQAAEIEIAARRADADIAIKQAQAGS